MDFAALYVQHRERIYLLALRLLRDRERAIDATQEAFAAAFAARRRFRGDCKPLTWLYRIAYNLCLDRLSRKDRVHVGLENVDKEDSEAGRPEPAAERRDMEQRLQSALAALAEADRNLLCLLLEENLSYEELASVVGCSQEALRMRACRARKRLRAVLEPVLGGEA